MLDLAFIREHPDIVKRAATAKRVDVDVDRLLELDGKRRELQREKDAWGQKKNESAKSFSKEHDARDEGRAIKERLAELETAFRAVDGELHTLLGRVPNIPSQDTPEGADASQNQTLRTVGEPPQFSFTPKEHWELGEPLGLDSTRAAQVSGSRFVYLKGDLALLEFALITHAFSVLTNSTILEDIRTRANLSVLGSPFTPVVPPALIKPDVFERMARLDPREERYHIERDDLFLVGSAEHTLGPLHMDETLPEEALPRRYVGFSSAFRREAGSHGKDVHGMLRVHQFDKVEMESFTVAEQAIAEQEFFVAIQEHMMQSLELPYRVVLLCMGEMGGPDARQIDIETWFPGQDRYRETHSADYMSDYQARRLRTKVRRASGATEFVHMNDATAFAIGRTIAALLEVHQQQDGTVRIPAALQPYMGGRTTFQPLDAWR
ncbi:MAG: seryl-tRNA synthetase [Parcubacteria group bacterium Gr01-1014_106]|nr:MAG: seryl-tRNA synthetase [Parcubacteria group bacterium Gr01-1014_106]